MKSLKGIFNLGGRRDHLGLSLLVGMMAMGFSSSFPIAIGAFFVTHALSSGIEIYRVKAPKNHAR